MYMQNLHTHCTYCDGKDTPREMIEWAIKKGFDSIGFSSHSPMFYSPAYAITPVAIPKYSKEIYSLRDEYADKIKIYCGWEYDMYSDCDMGKFDYLIGSMHYFKIGNSYIGFDRSIAMVLDVINTCFGGDGLRYAKRYYEEICDLPKYGDFDIIGHFDIITKQCENADLFDVNSKEYLNYAFEAISALKGKIPLFEVNTGAISRGYRTTPYPSIPIIKEFKRQGFGVVISSDCHDGEYLDCHFKESVELLKSCGFKEKYILTDNGFKAIGLEE